jgi:hypothetical protein
MVCVHLRRLSQLCHSEKLQLSGWDLIQLVCRQCGNQEVCPSVSVAQFDSEQEGSVAREAAEPGHAVDMLVERQTINAAASVP